MENLSEFKFKSLVWEDARLEIIELFERKYLHELLIQTEGQVSKAAEIAKVDRRTIYRLIRKHNVSTQQFK